MRCIRLAAVLALVLGLAFAGQALAQEVSQGKCLKNDKSAKTITVEEYDINFSKDAPYGKSTGADSVYDVSKAKVGITPETGDILRIAYVFEGDKRVAAKVMNVSKQDLRKK